MKKETLQNIVYSPLYLWFKLHAILPMRILYILSDILYFPLYYIVHYRRKLVSENLRKAFPDKTEKELKQLEQKFYHHFCDYIVETIKLMHISDEEMRRRMKFEQVEIIDRLFAENRSIIILLGHFGNWEWVPSVTLWTRTPDVMFAQIYRPLKNKWFDRFFLKLRSRFGSVCIAKQDTLRAILQMKRSGNSPASQRTARIRNHRSLHGHHGKNDSQESVGMVVDSQTLEIQTRGFSRYMIGKKSPSLYSTGMERIYCVNFYLRYVPIPMPI